MYQGKFEDYTIEIINDREYKVHSADNVVEYDVAYVHADDTRYRPAGSYGIRVSSPQYSRTAIVQASGGGTGANSESAVVDDGSLVIACSNKIFSLKLPNLELNWISGADIFVDIEHEGPTFEMHEDHIALMDFNGQMYRLSYDGKIETSGMAPRIKK